MSTVVLLSSALITSDFVSRLLIGLLYISVAVQFLQHRAACPFMQQGATVLKHVDQDNNAAATIMPYPLVQLLLQDRFSK